MSDVVWHVFNVHWPKHGALQTKGTSFLYRHIQDDVENGSLVGGGIESSKGWWVIFKRGQEEERREAFDFVIVATGVNAIPAIPDDYKARK